MFDGSFKFERKKIIKIMLSGVQVLWRDEAMGMKQTPKYMNSQAVPGTG